jgi:hypothetical protein
MERIARRKRRARSARAQRLAQIDFLIKECVF